MCHHGERSDEGHYTAFVRYGDCWFDCNDTNVTPIEWAGVRTASGNSAYLVVLQRRVDNKVGAEVCAWMAHAVGKHSTHTTQQGSS